MTKFVHVVYSLLSKNRSETAEHGRGGGGGGGGTSLQYF